MGDQLGAPPPPQTHKKCSELRQYYSLIQGQFFITFRTLSWQKLTPSSLPTVGRGQQQHTKYMFPNTKYMFPNTKYTPKIQKTIPQANCQLVVMGDNYLPDYIPFTVHPEKGLIKAPVQIRVCICRRNLGFCFCCFCCVTNSTLGCNGI